MNASATPPFPQRWTSGGSMSTAEIKARIDAMYSGEDTAPHADPPARGAGVSRRRNNAA
ncbi:hypothetical protein ACFWB0_01615 [Rhodococcus sp. NPDC060086]|uniref:hypothetical protein n=1 Tax=Rhodococcus sp. NPDC060086 TaxID=3347055 RepID=UPI0036608FC9